MVLKNFLAISKSFGELSNKDDFDNEIASIMGYTGVNIELWKRNKEIIAENSGNDIQDRVNALIYIKQGIFIHFEKDVSDQKLWIHEPRKELGNKSAWECLISGEMDGINMVASYVNRVIG